MDTGALLGSAVDWTGQIFGGWAQGEADKRSQKRAFGHDKKMAEYAYSKDLEMWQMQNQYNHPTAQMGRLSEAGINPHMAYSKGNMQNVAKEMPKYQEVNYPSYPRQSKIQTANAFAMYQQGMLNQAQAEAIRAQTRGTDVSTDRNQIQLGLDKQWSAFERLTTSHLKDMQSRSAWADAMMKLKQQYIGELVDISSHADAKRADLELQQLKRDFQKSVQGMVDKKIFPNQSFGNNILNMFTTEIIEWVQNLLNRKEKLPSNINPFK